jgi:hypothetical protein
VAAVVVGVVACTPVTADDAPDPHAVMPERPTVATHAHTVVPGWLELEAGWEGDRFADRSRGESVVSTAKLGLASHAQLGLTMNAVWPNDPAGSTGLGDVSLALKWRLLDAAPWLGDFALQPGLKLPTPGASERVTSTGTTDGSLLLISSHAFGPVSLDLNVGGTVRSGDGSAAPTRGSLWAAALGAPVVGNVGWASEVFGLPGTRGPAGSTPLVGLLFGPTWTPRPWLELDTGVIVPITGPEPHAYYAGGVWNVGRAWR